MTLKNVITKYTCASTVGGWIWYCDGCDTHGNADSSNEAKYMSEQHAKYHSWLSDDEDTNEDEDVHSYMDYDPLLRDNPELDWQSDCLSAVYIVDVSDEVTYSYWDLEDEE